MADNNSLMAAYQAMFPQGASLSNLATFSNPMAQQAPPLQSVPYQTGLDPLNEAYFRTWVKNNKIPFNPNDPKSDYDMRGLYKALRSGDPRAVQSANSNDGQMHFPDTWKTPYHKSFSNESIYATKAAPAWNSKDQLISPMGSVMFDERAQK